MNKALLPLAVASLAFLSSCADTEILTHSQIKQDFHAQAANPRVRVMLEGDETGFIPSNQEEKEAMRSALGEAIKEKGWEPASSIKEADYVLMCGFDVNASKPLSYTATTTGTSSVITADRAYITRVGMWLTKVNAKGGPGQEVWNGTATNASPRLGNSESRTDAAIALIEQEFPSRY